jgi:1-acyl-sn-glycerol-3-phosphate acyltransferase
LKIIKSILARVFAAWAMVTFIATFLVIFIPSMITWLIPNPFGQHVFIILARIWMRVWLTLVGCPVSVYGRKNFKKGETYIVTCNHNSFMDVPLSCPFIPGPNKTIAKKDFVKVPLFGFYYLKGSVIVDRKSDESRRQSYDKMKAVLKANMHMSVYPEGTRNKTDEPLKKFHDGAFRLSVETGNSIIPCVIFNTKKVLPAHQSFYFWPHLLHMHYLEPISPAGKTTEELKNEVFEKMKSFYLSKSEAGE